MWPSFRNYCLLSFSALNLHAEHEVVGLGPCVGCVVCKTREERRDMKREEKQIEELAAWGMGGAEGMAMAV